MEATTVRTLPPTRDYGPSSRDEAPGGFNLLALEELIQDCQGQPDWRPRADLAHAYYDMGKQLSSEKVRKIQYEMGIEPRQTNLIHGVINGVLGMEAKQRSDVLIDADEDDYQDVADVLSMRMKECTRESMSDMAISEAYAGQIKGGIGWVEVSRASDPLDYPYRTCSIHRREIWYDWRSQRIDLSDARWLVRKRWEDLDEAVAMMPQFKAILEASVNNNWDMVSLPDESDASIQTQLQLGYRNELRFVTTIRRDDWADSTRKRIKFFEVWYRVPAEVVVIHVGPTRRLVYDRANPVHIKAVAAGAKVSKAITRQIRMALFAGPHRLIDVPTTKRSFPYIPFFAFRDDEDRSPYGLIEGMMGPQDSYNDRRQMIDWMLKARQIKIDNDALDTDYNSIEEIKRTAARPDFTAVLNANRRNAAGVTIEAQLMLQKEQLEVMMNDKQTIQDVPRIYSTQLGDAPSGVTSGVAINSLTEAGVVAMGEVNDNYRFGRKLVHEAQLQLIVEDHLTEELRVTMGAGQSKRVIVLNTWTPEGEPLNHVKDAPVKVGLSDIPSSPAFRAQEQQQIAMMIQALQGNPAALNLLGAAYLEGSSLTNRQQLADDFRRATGQPVAGDRQAAAQAQAKQQQQLAEQEALAKAMATVQIEGEAAKIEETKSKTELNNAKVHEIGFSMGTGGDAGKGQQGGDEANPDARKAAMIQEALAEARGVRLN
jgi:hypothetical protein